MKAVDVPTTITLDLSELTPEDREIIHSQLVRVQKFVKDIPVIRGVRSQVADKFLISYKSKLASIFAESEIIAGKVHKGKVTLLNVSPNSTDAFYIQDSFGGIYTRLEIKSIIQDEASTVDKGITHAEVQHRDRLNDEEGKPTWHKTTIIIGNPENPWPFSHMEDLQSARDDRRRLLSEAETRIDRLLLGSLQPTKVMKREPDPLIKQRLAEAEERLKKIESNPLTPMKREPPVPRSPEVASLRSRSSSQSSKTDATDDNQAASMLPASASSSLTSKNLSNPPQMDQGRKLRPRRPEQLPKTEAPLTPITQMEKSRHSSRAKVIEKVSALSPDTRLERKMLVTEQVTVICPHLDLTFVLDRQANKFAAHIKGDQKPAGQVKWERQHWDTSTALIRKWRKSADKEGNNPLHLAIIEGDLDLIKFFSRGDMITSPNNNKDLPIHLAATTNNPEILLLLIEKGGKVDVINRRMDTPLHLACSAENVENVKILIQSGANLDMVNSSKQTPRSIIESSKNPKLKECLAIAFKPKV